MNPRMRSEEQWKHWRKDVCFTKLPRGRGNMMVEFFSAEIWVSVWRYLCNQHIQDDVAMMMLIQMDEWWSWPFSSELKSCWKRCDDAVKDVFCDDVDGESIDLSWRAAADSVMMSEASFNALLAFCSPSAAITWFFVRFDKKGSLMYVRHDNQMPY